MDDRPLEAAQSVPTIDRSVCLWLADTLVGGWWVGGCGWLLGQLLMQKQSGLQEDAKPDNNGN